MSYLKTSGLFDRLVEDAPFHYTSPNAPEVRDVVGTAVLAIICGFTRYVHINRLRNDVVLSMLLGLRKIVSEDSVRLAAGSPLPKSGEVLVSLRDEDKEAGAEVVRELSRLGFGVYATCGTSTRLWEAGVESKAIFRISRGRPNALDLLRRGEVKWVVCTAGNGNEATEDSACLRSGAVAAGVPLTTTLDGFRAAVRALAEEGSIGGAGVRTLQEYHSLSATRS